MAHGPNRYINMAAKTKTAKKATPKRTQKKKAKRYSDGKKAKIIAFVNQVNSSKGRGGVTAAVKKFGASPLSISNWIKGASGSKPGPKKGKGKTAKSGGGWEKLVALRAEIDHFEKGLEIRREKFNKLKKSL